MRIAELETYLVNLPLRREIKHASHARRQSASLVVRCRLADGTEGWGEGVPRPYVTGETAEDALEQLNSTPLTGQFDRECRSWDDVFALCERFQPAVLADDPRGCRSNSLRCAVELSVLDAYGRLFGESIRELTHRYAPASDLRDSKPVVRYSGAIMAEGDRAERLSALKMRLYGFAQCKVKVGVAGADDRRRLARIRRWLGGRMDVRVDANEAWNAAEADARIEPLLAYRISAVEQPLPHRQLAAMPELRRRLPVAMMLDESLTGMADAEEAVRIGACDLFNLRLSKCGGYLASLRLAAFAHRHGLGYQLGCHPGESAILSAAGRHWACSVRDIRYLEGSYDRHVLGELLTVEDITFGYGGRAPALAGPGLGVTVRTEVLDRVAFKKQTFRLD
ncbi:MAG: dipeptide epimerase [Pirellulales bacterium]|nr:dipeptide epimerase [Pirellulales bacterium]